MEQIEPRQSAAAPLMPIRAQSTTRLDESDVRGRAGRTEKNDARGKP